jgi:hypothetical protein
MLVVSTMFYVLAEYRVRQIDNVVDEVFEEPTIVNQTRDNWTLTGDSVTGSRFYVVHYRSFVLPTM